MLPQEALINTSRYADGTIGPLAAFLELHNYDAQLMLKTSCDRLRGEPHQPGNVAHNLNKLFVRRKCPPLAPRCNMSGAKSHGR